MISKRLLVLGFLSILVFSFATITAKAQSNVSLTKPKAGDQHATKDQNKQVESTAETTQTTTRMHGRQGGVPPGLVGAWAHSHMSVVARAVTHAIFLNGTHGVELAEIAMNASSNGQVIDHLDFNASVMQITFDKPGSVVLSAVSSEKPKVVFADDVALSEDQSTDGLTPDSEAWVYDENHHTIVVFADPSSVTFFYGTTPATPIPEFPIIALAGILGIAVFAGIALKRRSTPILSAK